MTPAPMITHAKSRATASPPRMQLHTFPTVISLTPPQEPVPPDIITVTPYPTNIDFFSRGRQRLYKAGVPREGGGWLGFLAWSRIGPGGASFFSWQEFRLTGADKYGYWQTVAYQVMLAVEGVSPYYTSLSNMRNSQQ